VTSWVAVAGLVGIFGGGLLVALPPGALDGAVGGAVDGAVEAGATVGLVPAQPVSRAPSSSGTRTAAGGVRTSAVNAYRS
jgi:hypothetical protein